MSLNGYDSAFAQATQERADIRTQIERLLTRGELLDKLMETLAPFVSTPKAEGEHEAHHEHAEEHAA